MNKIATKEHYKIPVVFSYLSAILAKVGSNAGGKMDSAIKSFLHLITKIKCRSLAYTLLIPKLILTFTTNSKVRDNTFSFFIGNFSKVIYRWNSIVTNFSENNAYDKRNRKYHINCDCPFHQHPLKHYTMKGIL